MKKIYILLLMFSLMLSSCGRSEEVVVTKTPFPEIVGVDFEGNTVTNDIFSEYDATVVNFWNNYCGTCIEEMPELEEYFQQFKEKNINLIGVGTDSSDSEESLQFAKEIIASKGVTYANISPNQESLFYNDFIEKLPGYPTTYIVDSDGNIIGTPIVGNVKSQEEGLSNRLNAITKK